MIEIQRQETGKRTFSPEPECGLFESNQRVS